MNSVFSIIIENRIGSGSSYIHAKHARSKSARAATGFWLPPALRIRALPFKQWVWSSNLQRVTKSSKSELFPNWGRVRICFLYANTETEQKINERRCRL